MLEIQAFFLGTSLMLANSTQLAGPGFLAPHRGHLQPDETMGEPGGDHIISKPCAWGFC